MRKVADKITKEQAEELAREANERLHAFRDAERVEENKGLVGKAFKTRNSYSCPEKPSDYWWHYAKVQRMDNSGHLYIISFEKDKYGHVSIRRNEHRYHMGGYTPIPAAEFNKAWRSLQAFVAGIDP